MAKRLLILALAIILMATVVSCGGSSSTEAGSSVRKGTITISGGKS